MLKSYITITIRNLIRNKTYALINIFGLALGISICTIIFLLIRYELSYDKFHSKIDRIYRVVSSTTNVDGIKHRATVPYPTGGAIAEEITDLEVVTQIHWDYERQINIGDERFYQDGIAFADSAFFDVFDFEILIGNPRESLKQINVAFITKSIAEKYFGDSQSSIGQTIRLANTIDLEVKGVVADPPKTSHLPFSMIVSYSSLTEEHVGGFSLGWGTTLSGYTYVLLSKNSEEVTIEYQLEALIEKMAMEDENFDNFSLYLQPFADIHFDQQYADSAIVPTARVNFLYTLGFIGFFIIVLGSINFINLSTALSIKRSKEVGIRKALGARRKSLIIQFLGDSAVITFLALIFATGIVERVLVIVNNFMDKELIFNPFTDPVILFFLLGTLLVVTFLSGLYPAFILSGYQPVKVLKSSISGNKGSSLSMRKVLVTFQFFISQALIVATIIIVQQLVFFKNQPLGFNSEAVITVSLYERDSMKLMTLKNSLLNHPSIEKVSFGVGVPTSINSLGTSMYLSEHEDSEDFHRVRIKSADHDYLDIFGIPLLAGKWYGEAHNAHSGIVINETAARTLGFQNYEEAIGEFLHLGLNGIDAPIIGIVKDFHTKSLHNEIQSVVLLPFYQLYYEAGIKINSQNLNETTDFVKEEWDRAFPGYIFEYEFMDDYILSLYEEEDRMLALSKMAAFIAILIGCMGLYGLVSFIAVQRTKEVGIRKALGASIGNIISQFSKEFIILLSISFIISIPIVWILMNKWLQSFAYKIDIQPWFFIAGFFVTLVIAGLTIGYKSVKAAYANPIDALKEE